MGEAIERALLGELDALERDLAELLRELPGARALLLFGSRAAERGDPYADLDLHLICADSAAARSVWPQALGLLAPLDLVWPLDPSGLAFSVGLRGSSPFHKIDISIGVGPGLPAPLDSAGAQVLWEQPPAAAGLAAPAAQAFWPAHGSYGHVLVEELISATRYVKARRRGRALSAWRFMRSRPDVLLSLRAATLGGARPAAPLSTWAIRRLEAQLGPGEQAALLSALDWSSPAAMDRACLALTAQIVELAGALAAAAGEPGPGDWPQRQLGWLAAELAPAGGPT